MLTCTDFVHFPLEKLLNGISRPHFWPKIGGTEQPKISFGRYSDSYKDSSRYTAWDVALEKFDSKEYLESYKQFFYYLRDEEEENVRCEEVKGGLQFELYQGSKNNTRHGYAQKGKVEIRSSGQALNVAFMRRCWSKTLTSNTAVSP